MKKFISLVICILMIVLNMQVFAYDYPSNFWSINTKYESAINTNDYSKIIEYGNQIINLMQSATDGSEKRNILLSRYRQVGIAYAALGEYESAANTFQTLYQYASTYGNAYKDYVRASKERVNQYTAVITMYTDNGTPTYYGAKNEKRNGVLFGICADGPTRKETPNESMILTYQELGYPMVTYNVGVLREASKSGCAVEYALNCPNKAADIRNIQNMTSQLKEISDLLKKYADVPIYLRFAAEFDIWDNLVDADSFKSAFRYVSNYFKERNSNVAIVWSPNYASNGTINIDDFYPGDEYVDWVGLSLYAQPYFLSDKTQPEENEILFKSGINSNPVIAVKEIVEKYGNRKPIMISESGCAHKDVKNNEDTSAFALQRLKEYYSYLPMVYPQIKLIAYFDNYVEADGEQPDFRLSTNSTLKNEYLKLTKGARFIQDSYSNNVDYCYRSISNGTQLGSVFPVSCYVHSYNNSTRNVTYYIDGQYVGASNELPFSVLVDASKYSGQHTLKAVASLASGQTLQTESTVSISNAGENITVEISGDRVYFDQNPILYNDRTMVPMRKIFEELGAAVSWDNNIQTATGRKGDRTVKVTIGSYKMYVNSKEIVLDTPPVILSDRTLVPVRAIAEGLGCIVDWDGRYSLVSITPKVFRWSDWETELPNDVDDDLYYIERRNEYRYRTRQKDYYTRDTEEYYGNLANVDTRYGEWTDWIKGNAPIKSGYETQTKIDNTPKRYHYAHYCTGNISDTANKYKTWDHWWHNECTYHDLGWFDQKLPMMGDDDVSYVQLDSNGNKQRCSNSCYRWYLIETSGGAEVMYRQRRIFNVYTYWQWGEWSRWSNWDEDEPYDYYYNDTDMDIESRRVYRYKEK